MTYTRSKTSRTKKNTSHSTPKPRKASNSFKIKHKTSQKEASVDLLKHIEGVRTQGKISHNERILTFMDQLIKHPQEVGIINPIISPTELRKIFNKTNERTLSSP